jgi:hypothetical protein
MFLLAGGLPRSVEAAGPSRALPEVTAELYVDDPVSLKPVECGQCHIIHYSNLKDAGGRHRFACQECHEQFHRYSPLLNNYAELMPQCGTCHGEPHGSKQTACADCHRNPHAPQRAPAIEQLSAICADCHAGPAEKLTAFPSAHTEQGCDACHHDTHGYIPDCLECHEGHYQGQTLEECAACHQDVHKPVQIALGGDTDVQTCAACHETVHAQWAGTLSKHGSVNCGQCHTSHGFIPNCQDCHSLPHDPKQLKIFPNCLDCHLDVHDLPVK